MSSLSRIAMSHQRHSVTEQSVAASGINPIYSQTTASEKLVAIEEEQEIYAEVPGKILKQKRRDLKECSLICCLFFCPSVAVLWSSLAIVLNILITVGTITPFHVNEELTSLRATLESLQRRGQVPESQVTLKTVDYDHCVYKTREIYMNLTRLYDFEIPNATLPHYISGANTSGGVVSYDFIYQPLNGNSSDLKASFVLRTLTLGEHIYEDLVCLVDATFDHGSDGIGRVYYKYCPYRTISVYTLRI